MVEATVLDSLVEEVRSVERIVTVDDGADPSVLVTVALSSVVNC